MKNQAKIVSGSTVVEHWIVDFEVVGLATVFCTLMQLFSHMQHNSMEFSLQQQIQLQALDQHVYDNENLFHAVFYISQNQQLLFECRHIQHHPYIVGDSDDKSVWMNLLSSYIFLNVDIAKLNFQKINKCVCLNFWHKKLREIYLICHNINKSMMSLF